MSEKNIEPIKITSIKNEIIKKLSVDSKKGENGCVATIGGSLEYTGAPYYSAISALKAGSDLSHVFCHKESAIPIKSYSPELIVHPGFDAYSNDILLKKTERWFKSMNSILIGPGMGREPDIEKIFVEFSEKISEFKNIPLVYDADGVWFWVDINTKNEFDKNILEKINNNEKLIMTPNFTEFEKMCKILGDKFKKENIEEQKKFIDDIYNKQIVGEEVIKINNFINIEKYKDIFINEINLCQEFKNKFILVKKGKCDIITDGKELYIVRNKGSLKRTGGIGDLLSGLINCYCGMINQHLKENKEYNQKCLLTHDILIKCCILACFICRAASESAFEKMKYSLTAPDIISELPNIVNKIYYS